MSNLNCNASNVFQDSSNPLYRIPVFLSYANPFNSLQTQFLNTIIEEIREELLFPRTLGRSDQYVETPLISIRRMMLSSYGLIAVAFRRAFVTKATARPGTPQEQVFENFWLSSPYLQIEPAMAIQAGLPVMILVENGVSMNGTFGGVLELGAGPYNIIQFSLQNEQSITDFFNNVFWRETFVDWVGRVRCCYNKKTDIGC